MVEEKQNRDFFIEGLGEDDEEYNPFGAPKVPVHSTQSSSGSDDVPLRSSVVLPRPQEKVGLKKRGDNFH